MPPRPLIRGQGNDRFKTADSRRGAKRGQTIPYDINGAPTGAAGIAADVSFAPAGSVAATNVQAAIQELDSEKAVAATVTAALALKQPLDADLTALAALSGTNTLYYRSAADTWSGVTFGSGIGFSGGALTLGAITPTSVNATGTIAALAAGDASTLQSTNTAAPASGNTSGGKLGAGADQKPTAADQRIGVVIFSAKDSASVQQASARIAARSSEDWGSLAGQGTYLEFQITAPGAFAPSVAGTLKETGLDIVGELRGDSLRIDAAPSASVATPSTHKLAVNLNGTTYYLLATT